MDLSTLKDSPYCTSFNADFWILESNGWTALVIQGRVQFGKRPQGLQAVDWQEAAGLLVAGSAPDEVALGVETVEL